MSISYFLAFVLIGAGFALLYGAVRESKQALRLRRTAWVVFAATALYIAGTDLHMYSSSMRTRRFAWPPMSGI